jgi:hypothetical protein
MELQRSMVCLQNWLHPAVNHYFSVCFKNFIDCHMNPYLACHVLWSCLLPLASCLNAENMSCCVLENHQGEYRKWHMVYYVLGVQKWDSHALVLVIEMSSCKKHKKHRNPECMSGTTSRNSWQECLTHNNNNWTKKDQDRSLVSVRNPWG